MKKAKLLTVFLLVVVFILSCASCKQEKNDTWPETGLATQLPKPESGKLEINYDDNDDFIFSLEEIEKNEYEEYLSACKEKGFTIEPEQSSSNYSAFNEEGYHLSVHYYSSSSKISINLDAPIEIGDLKWPMGTAGKAVPEPSSKKGTVSWEHDDSFYLYVGETTFADYNSYVDKCIEAGFVVDYSKGKKYYRAKNSNHFSIDVEYKGFNIMSIGVEWEDKAAKSSGENNSNASILESSELSEINSDNTSPVIEPESSEPNPQEESASPVSQTSEKQESHETAAYRSLIDETINEYKELAAEYSAKYEEVKSKLGNSYNSYVNGQSYLTEWFNNFKDAYSSLFLKTDSMTKTVFDKIKATIPANEYDKWNDELDYIYKNFYSTAFDILLQEIYEGTFDSILSEYYNTILDTQPDGIDYSTWLNTKTDFYSAWINARSDFYSAWINARSDFYSAYLNAKSDLYTAYLESL